MSSAEAMSAWCVVTFALGHCGSVWSSSTSVSIESLFFEYVRARFAPFENRSRAQAAPIL